MVRASLNLRVRFAKSSIYHYEYYIILYSNKNFSRAHNDIIQCGAIDFIQSLDITLLFLAPK